MLQLHRHKGTGVLSLSAAAGLYKSPLANCAKVKIFIAMLKHCCLIMYFYFIQVSLLGDGHGLNPGFHNVNICLFMTKGRRSVRNQIISSHSHLIQWSSSGWRKSDCGAWGCCFDSSTYALVFVPLRSSKKILLWQESSGATCQSFPATALPVTSRLAQWVRQLNLVYTDPSLHGKGSNPILHHVNIIFIFMTKWGRRTRNDLTTSSWLRLEGVWLESKRLLVQSHQVILFLTC